MNTLFIFLLTFVAIDCNAFEDIDIKSSQSSPTNDSEPSLGKCPQKCLNEIAILKKNMSELQTAFVTLREQLDHMNRHLSFHEKALKHIAVWGHKPNPHHNHDMGSNEHDIDSHNQSLSVKDLTQDSNRETKSHLDRQQGNHHHIHHHRHPSRPQNDPDRHHNHHHTHHSNGNRGCTPCPSKPGYPHAVDNEFEQGLNKLASNKSVSEDENKKESSEENSSEEVTSKPLTTPIPPNAELDNNGTDQLNDSHIPNPSDKEPKRIHFSKPTIEEQLYFQSMESEFKEWFNNMLNDIHRKSSGGSDNGFKGHKRSDQSAIDEMENALNSEDLIFATCNMKANRHITLLNQQDIEGTINMWQLSNNRGPLHMHIKLKGFKVNNHENNHKNGDHKARQTRETNLMPVEQEPDEPTQLTGASHSHGFHVHEFGNLSRDCQSVGNHYNPLNLAHGGPYDVIRHVGDLGNIRCDRNGQIDAEYTYSQVSLSGPHSIVNRSFVIHSNIDDFGRKPNNPSSAQTGSSGVRIACCVIEEVKQLPKEEDTETKIGSVAAPMTGSKRKRDTSEPVFVNRHRFEESTLSQIERKFKNFESRRKHDIRFE